MMLTKVGVYLSTRGAKEEKRDSLSLLYQVVLRREIKLLSLSLIRPSGLKKVGQGNQDSKLGFVRPSGL
jgi:hypothetical protein